MQLTNQNGEPSFGGLVELVQKIEDNTSLSLFQYTKRATINSRVFIEKTLSSEEILTPLMSNIMNLYSGLILTALNMNQYIAGSKKIRDILSIVATESLKSDIISSDEKMNAFFMGSKPTPLFAPKMDLVSSDGSPLTSGQHTQIASTGSSSVKDLKPKVEQLPAGRLIEFKFGYKGGDFTVNIFLQLNPMYIPSSVAEQFVAINFTPSIKQRYMQVQAGEISMIKDLIMGADRRKKRLKALKQDNTGTLKEMIERQENSLANSWMKLSFVQPERQNLANTILIFDKRNFDKYCSNNGLRFKDYNSRQKFMNKTFTMMVCTVDPMYNRVEMFYHGLPAVSEFTFEQIKRNEKTESTDLMSIMKTYAQGMAPKF